MPRTRPDVSFASVLISAVVLAVVGHPFIEQYVSQRGGKDPVAEALADLTHRPTVARLSVAARYGTYERVIVPKVAMALERSLNKHPRSNHLEHLHPLGMAQLLSGDRAGAVRQLAEAVALAESEPIGPERRAAILNDFAVAQLEVRDAKSLVIALDAVEKAWALNHTPAIAWTRAVALSSLATEDVAANAWGDYLALDPKSLWTGEAVRRRAQLGKRRPRRPDRDASVVVAPPDTGFSLIERYDELVAAYMHNNQLERAAKILIHRAEALDHMRSTDEAWSDLVKARGLVSGRTMVGRQVVGALAEAAARSGYTDAALALSNGSMGMPPGPHAVQATARLTSDPDEIDLSIELVGLPPLPGASSSYDAAIELMVEAEERLHRRQATIEIANGSLASALWMSDRARGAHDGNLARCANRDRSRSVAKRGRQLAQCLPAGVTIVHQDLGTETLNTWIIRNGTITFHTTSVSALRLRAQIETFVDDIHTAQRLYDILLRPIEQHIAGNNLLVYSPSPNLRDVPFGALHDGTAFLVQRRPVMTTVSISSFELPRTLARTSSALVMLPIAAPLVADLPGARREVRTVSEIYGTRATLVTDDTATPETFLGRATEYDILHLSSHGYASDIPYQNAIEFGARRIRAYDVYRLRLRRAPVVVLAACRTASDSGGPLNMSMAKAFLRAGASAVVGSLWNVEDEVTADLSIAFHRELARGATPQDALRTVQLQFIRAGKPIAAWAAFQVSS